MNNRQIKVTFNEIVRDCKMLTRPQLEIKHKDFIKDFPKLFEKATTIVTDEDLEQTTRILEMMLESSQSQKDGKTTKVVTDMMVGNQLGKEFIFPKTGTPSQSDYNAAVQKILNAKPVDSDSSISDSP